MEKQVSQDSPINAEMLEVMIKPDKVDSLFHCKIQTIYTCIHIKVS